jgi:hypothetical protein
MLTVESEARQLELALLTSPLFLLKQNAYRARDFGPSLMFGLEASQRSFDRQL